MTPAQHGRYWREWRQIRKLLTGMGEFSAKDADAERMAIHERALGQAKSSKDLTNRDLDKIFLAFGKYLVLERGPSTKPPEDQDRKRLVWAIEHTGLEPAYLATICQAQHKREDWQNLPLEDLQKFRFTATSRAADRKRAKQQQP